MHFSLVDVSVAGAAVVVAGADVVAAGAAVVVAGADVVVAVVVDEPLDVSSSS